MSSITLNDLMMVNVERFHTAAAAWKALADDLDRGFEAINAGALGLGDAWPLGSAAEAAVAKTEDVRAEINAAYSPANRIGQALSTHAYAVADLRGQTAQLLAAASDAGCVIDLASGTVTVPGQLDLGEMTNPIGLKMRRTLDGDAARAWADGIARDLATVLERARGLDDATVGAISANLPDPATGFGRLSAPAVTAADLASQRGRDPEDVNAWWRSLTPQQQEQAVRDFPEAVGWLDGVPAVDRDTANRIMLDRHQDTLTQRREDLQRQIRALVDDDTATVAQVERLRGQLHEVDTKLARLDLNERKLTSLGDRGLLLGIDPAGDGRVIISVGNPDTARHTAVWVPGLGTDLGSTDGNVNRVLNLQREADKATRGVDGDVATIMWLGYDAPETDGSVVTSTRSRQGAAALDSFVNGLRATHGGGDYHLTAVGHSYGSTVVAEAALGGEQPGNPRGLAVDDIVTAGSPGMHTSSASDLNIDAQHVWAGSAENDLVANFANVPAATVRYVSPLAAAGIEGIDMVHGASPHEPSFGANQYVVDTSGHSDYWEYDENGEATESLRNQAKVVAGRYDEVGLEHEASWE